MPLWLLVVLLGVTFTATGSTFVPIARTRAVPMPSSRTVRETIAREVSQHPDARVLVRQPQYVR